MWWHLTVARAGNLQFLGKQTSRRQSELRDLAAKIRTAWPNTALTIILTAPDGQTEEL
jgi:hypothetical protein